MAAEIWIGDEKIANWSRPQLPSVGDTIGIMMYDEAQEAEVLSVEESIDRDGSTTTRTEIIFTGDP